MQRSVAPLGDRKVFEPELRELGLGEVRRLDADGVVE
jgi:hypothetical protein